jgi:hypothetical protein
MSISLIARKSRKSRNKSRCQSRKCKQCKTCNKRIIRGGDCGCASSSSVSQSGGRVMHSSEYYGHDSGSYNPLNTATPYLDSQNAERMSAFNILSRMAGGSRRSNRRNSSKRAPKYTKRYSNISKGLIRSRSNKSRRTSMK